MRRFRLRYPAPINSGRWKCKWIDCAHGMGLAGMGRCSGVGDCGIVIVKDIKLSMILTPR